MDNLFSQLGDVALLHEIHTYFGDTLTSEELEAHEGLRKELREFLNTIKSEECDNSKAMGEDELFHILCTVEEKRRRSDVLGVAETASSPWVNSGPVEGVAAKLFIRMVRLTLAKGAQTPPHFAFRVLGLRLSRYDNGEFKFHVITLDVPELFPEVFIKDLAYGRYGAREELLGSIRLAIKMGWDDLSKGGEPSSKFWWEKDEL